MPTHVLNIIELSDPPPVDLRLPPPLGRQPAAVADDPEASGKIPLQITLGKMLVLLITPTLADNVLVRPWGENALRIQLAPKTWALTDVLPTAYLPHDGFFAYGADVGAVNPGRPVQSGNIKAETGDDGLLAVTRVADSKVLFRESGRAFGAPGSELSVTFDFSPSSTKVYGMGQNRHANNGPGLKLNVINETYSFQASIGEEGGPSNSLPWAIAAHPGAGGFQFGVLFNSPSLGGVAFNDTSMTWSIGADAGNQRPRQQFDFLVSTHAAGAKDEEKPFQIVEKYVDAVGHARKLPYPGYWHSKNRYSTQDQLIEVARGFHNRSIPVDVIVIDCATGANRTRDLLLAPPHIERSHGFDPRTQITTAFT